MKRIANEPRFTKYADLGGLKVIAQRFEHGDITISEVARFVGCSRGTIYNDFIRQLGSKRYALILHNRKIIAETTPSNDIDMVTIKKRLIQRAETSTKEEAKKFTSIVDVLKKAESARITFTGVENSSGSIRYYLPDGRTVRIRTAIINGDQREHRFGLHRFRVSPGVTEYDFVIFAIRLAQTTVLYIFKSSEIATIQSLALRFKWFHRSSRYDYARDRWSILI